MGDATKRVNYFDRQFLRAADFQDAAAYELDRRRRHNRLLHASGVADGLVVTGTVGDTFVTVAPGTAYDDLGQEIVLPQPQQVSMPGGNSPLYLSIAYWELPSDPSSDPGVTGNTRISENPMLAVSATPPPDPDLKNHALLLAAITLDNSQKITAVDTNPPGRKRAGGLPPKSVGTNELADGSVTTSKIADGAVTQTKLADAAVITSKIADNAVTQAKIPDGAITQVKIAASSISMRELKSTVLHGTLQASSKSPGRTPPLQAVLDESEPARSFYIASFSLALQQGFSVQNPTALNISWLEEFSALLPANSSSLDSKSIARVWRVMTDSVTAVTVVYTIYRIAES